MNVEKGRSDADTSDVERPIPEPIDGNDLFERVQRLSGRQGNAISSALYDPGSEHVSSTDNMPQREFPFDTIEDARVSAK